ncbi:LamG-like jellyroll fold domain-containing protein [Anaerobaca lacustris]|uniref:Discoidin domain-containing protein n=1 Tax=Anaerobaca lacustris TaxID=3044600 RepID=A0AAW6U0V4_9BACT|nr:discoidin domain-containing protein [Sedimentisphaerales bacterium M17dextr]
MVGKLSCLILCLGVLCLVSPSARGDLVGHWPFDGNLNDVAGTANGTFSGGQASYEKGRVRQAISFDGVDDYVDIPSPANPSVYTIAAWVRPARTSAAAVITRTDASGPTTSWSHQLRINAVGQFHHYLWVGAERHVSGTTVIVPDTWYHVIIMAENNGPMRIFVNGIEEGTSISTAGTLWATGTRIFVGSNSGHSMGWFQGLVDDLRIYDEALAADQIRKIMRGDAAMSFDAYPEDGTADVPRDMVLAWTPGEFAAAHDVYFGTVFDDVNDASRANPRGVLVSQGQAVATYDPAGVLDFETTYYWRIDEVNAPPTNTIFKGDVWGFTTEPVGYPIANIVATSNGRSEEAAGPQNTVNGSGLDAADQHSTASDDMWLATPGADPLWIQYEFDRVYKLHQMLVWNYNVQFELLLGFGIKNVTVEYSENGTDWASLGDVDLARATAKATYTANTIVDFGGVPVKYVRLNVNSGYGMMGQYGLSEVRFLFIPAQAREPQPAAGATDVEVGTALSWRSGREAVSHEVYLGTDADALTLAGTVGSPVFAPSDLQFGRTYHWRIDEVNEADAVTVWAGEFWSFSTQEYALIDGFETYNDDIDAGTAIFDTWLDGWVNNTGSTVGHLQTPFAERTIVHRGRQAMPLFYDNTNSPFYSEAERTFANTNWSGNGADTLVLYVRGNAPAFAETADGQIIMNAIGSDIWGAADQFRFAYKSLSGNGSIVVRVDSLIRSDEWAKAGVMIRETLEAGSKHAFVAVTPTPSHGVSFQRRPVAAAASANTDVADIAIPHWVKLTRTGNLLTAQQSQDGVNWVNITPATPVEITMAANVYIGLALTSHNTTVSTAAEFSNVTMTGSVTGAWQTAEIGVTQPTGNDSAEPMYVRIEDATGRSATVVNPDEAITLRPSWQEWRVSYGDLAGVNLGRVQKMVIGVGSKTSPRAGGKGVVYVDDIGFGRPAGTR